MKHIVLFSGGLGSYFTTKRLFERGIPKEDIILLFTDTKVEDEDLYRFLKDAENKLGIPVTNYSDGRDIWQVFKDEKFLANNRLDFCSKVLKRDMARKFIKNFSPDEIIIYLGFDWTEMNRFEKARRNWLPYKIESPMCEQPYFDKEDMKKMLSDDNIELPRLYKMGFSHNNCFSGDTRYITEDGIKNFIETSGSKQMVLSSGKFIESEIKNFGKQKLYELIVEQKNYTKTIYTTSEHRWILYVSANGNSRMDKTTLQLDSGDFLVTQYGFGMSGVRSSYFGISHGIVFSGGKQGVRKNAPAYIEFSGEKENQLIKYFPNSPIIENKEITKISDLPRYFLEYPSMNESKSYLLGWLSGYFSKNGMVKKDGGVKIFSYNIEDLFFIKNICCKLAIGTTPIKTETKLGFDDEYHNSYYFFIVRKTIDENFFILKEHRINFTNNPISNKRNPAWKVISIKETERFEDVFCAVVPDSHSFVLEDNILTGNCGRGCVKAGIGHFANLLEKFPERFSLWENNEQEIRDFLGKNVTILRRTKNNITKNITLKELREEKEFLTNSELCEIGGCGCFQE